MKDYPLHPKSRAERLQMETSMAVLGDRRS